MVKEQLTLAISSVRRIVSKEAISEKAKSKLYDKIDDLEYAVSKIAWAK